jgi:hypothetical protein
MVVSHSLPVIYMKRSDVHDGRLQGHGEAGITICKSDARIHPLKMDIMVRVFIIAIMYLYIEYLTRPRGLRVTRPNLE